ncbi:MAG: roadblock/LC7 domain-containing protein [Candidatus Sericytochromatia bacterium]|nr:roadblock/LC7 domain-containing protein [Candidatus Sericytochromatia bacterium]
MLKTKKIKVKLPISLFNYISLLTLLMMNVTAIAATTNNTLKTTTRTISSPLPLVGGIVAVIILGVLIFMLTKKKDNTRIALPNNSNKSSSVISPNSPNKSVIHPTTPKNNPVVTPVMRPNATGPIYLPKVEMPVATPNFNNANAQPQNKVVPPKVEMPVATPNFNNSTDAKPLFDSDKLDSDLDNIFTDPKNPTKVEEEQKKAPLFDSGQLDSDLDALFVEVNKKPEKVKEEKKGLFDSNQLDSDLDSLFTDNSQPSKSSSDNLSDLFGSTPEPIQAQKSNDTFDLGSLDFLSSDKKEEIKSESFSLPNLDLSSLTGSNSAPAQKSNDTFDLGSLDFLSSNKKEETKSESFALPSFDLSSLTNSTNDNAKDNSKANVNLDSKNIDLGVTTMGLNISDYLSSLSSTDKKESKQESTFSLTDTVPPQSLDMNNFSLNSPVSEQLISQTSEEKKKSASGVISIGKMLVDQSALEEIIKKAEKGGKAGLTTTQVITAVKGRSLDTLLVDIDNIDGIMGSIIVGKDGLVIANTMPSQVDKDLVGALTSSLFTNIDGQVKKLKKGNLKRLTVETAIGTYILTEIEMGTLVVFTSDNKKINLTNVFKAITTVTGKR